jgi:hypothetical protein
MSKGGRQSRLGSIAAAHHRRPGSLLFNASWGRPLIAPPALCSTRPVQMPRIDASNARAASYFSSHLPNLAASPFPPTLKQPQGASSDDNIPSFRPAATIKFGT